MKKFCAMLMAVWMALSVAACSSPAANSQANQPPADANTPPVQSDAPLENSAFAGGTGDVAGDSRGNFHKYREELEPLSIQQEASSGDVSCEYDVDYYAAYCDEKKLWEVCPQKQIYTIGNTKYPFPNNV